MNNDRKKRTAMIKKAFEIIYKAENPVYLNIIGTFKNFGFKKSSLLIDAIFYIKEKYIVELKHELEWINHRTVNKIDYSEKNSIFCCLLNLDPENFIKYLGDFLRKKEPNEEKINGLICELQKIIRNTLMTNPNITEINNIDTNKTTLKKEQIKEDKRNENQKTDGLETENEQKKDESKILLNSLNGKTIKNEMMETPRIDERNRHYLEIYGWMILDL